MSIDGKRRLAAAAFVALLLLSVFWPAPVVTLGAQWLHAPLPIDDLSFLGREAPSWDVVFWCIAGLFALAIVQSGEHDRHDLIVPWQLLRATRPRLRAMPLLTALAASIAVVALTWRFADARVTAWAESLQSDRLEDVIRIVNRFGGGMNPPMIVLFFLLAGICYRHRDWLSTGIAMALAGLGAGIFVQVLKYSVGRTRPELWLGPFQHARASATSFPSGHTVGAFALAGVLIFTARSRVLRVLAFVLAAAVGLARIFAFRHWSSDVLASAIVGLLVAWIVTAAVRTAAAARA
jgi:membrane-associated phospholipid phosphatase